jgi:NAD(P)-dependent dehydrogenase (short-subunit alcohol dehydrogenase family)
MKNTFDDFSWVGLAGKVCVVTGAASGIGSAIAEQLAFAGGKVALLDLDGVAAKEAADALCSRGLSAIGIECDVSDETAVISTARRVNDELGSCTALVNNAGMLRPSALTSVTLEEWNKVISVNLTAYLVCSRAFSDQMQAAGGGSIVHVASISANHPQTRSGAYSASKAGVLLLSRQIAAEWGPAIRSNVVCPGMIRTALSAKFYEEPGFEEKRAAVTAAKRVGEPIDIANAALFLLSDRSSYVTGAEVAINGGMDAMLMDLVPRPGFNSTGNSQRTLR